MKKKQKPVFGVTEIFGNGLKNNFMTNTYLPPEESKEFTRIVIGGNRKAKSILAKRKYMKAVSKKAGGKLTYGMEQEEARKKALKRKKKERKKTKRMGRV